MTADRLAEVLDELLDVDAASLTDGELHDAMVDLGRQTARLRAAWCRLIREWDVRQVWADNGSNAAGARLERECRMRKAAADHLVHQARELASMPHTAEAFAAVEITSDHVDLLSTASGSGRDAAFATDEAELVEQCKSPWHSISPKSEEALKAAGIITYAGLAATAEPAVRGALFAGHILPRSNVATWAMQASYAANGDWQGLTKYNQRGSG